MLYFKVKIMYANDIFMLVYFCLLFLGITNIVFPEAVRRNRMSASATDADINTITKTWLRSSGDRGGGRRDRQKKKMLENAGANIDDAQSVENEENSNSICFCGEIVKPAFIIRSLLSHTGIRKLI